MLRVSRLSTKRSLSPPETLKAIEAGTGLVAAANKVQGVKNCRLYLNAGDLIIAGEADGYGAVDRILADAGVQSSAAILIQEFGYALTADDFFLDPRAGLSVPQAVT